jgi:hypothetical protein
VSSSQGDVVLSCPGAVELGVLLPHLAGAVVEEVVVAGDVLLVMARARRLGGMPGMRNLVGPGPQPLLKDAGRRCGGGRPVEIRLAARRFTCPVPGCERKIFCGQVQGLTARHARKTPPLAAFG